jgi:addiction module HigA family antidote
VPLTRVVAILKGKRSVSPDTALRLGAYTGTGPEFWLNLQANYDLQMAQRALPQSQLAEIARRRPTPAA